MIQSHQVKDEKKEERLSFQKRKRREFHVSFYANFNKTASENITKYRHSFEIISLKLKKKKESLMGRILQAKILQNANFLQPQLGTN